MHWTFRIRYLLTRHGRNLRYPKPARGALKPHESSGHGSLDAFLTIHRPKPRARRSACSLRTSTRAAQPQTRAAGYNPFDIPATVASATGAPGGADCAPGHSTVPLLIRTPPDDDGRRELCRIRRRPNPAAPGAGVPAEAPISMGSAEHRCSAFGCHGAVRALCSMPHSSSSSIRTGSSSDENAFTEAASSEYFSASHPSGAR